MNFSKELMKGTSEIIVLKALYEEGEAYGYQLITTIQHSSDNIFQFKEGTLYPLLYRLEDKNYITSKEKTGPNGKKRRYYSITQKGIRILREKITETKSFIDALNQVLIPAKKKSSA